jgi:hypothetical protein
MWNVCFVLCLACTGIARACAEDRPLAIKKQYAMKDKGMPFVITVPIEVTMEQLKDVLNEVCKDIKYSIEFIDGEDIHLKQESQNRSTPAHVSVGHFKDKLNVASYGTKVNPDHSNQFSLDLAEILADRLNEKKFGKKD